MCAKPQVSAVQNILQHKVEHYRCVQKCRYWLHVGGGGGTVGLSCHLRWTLRYCSHAAHPSIPTSGHTKDSWVMCSFFCKPFTGYRSNPEQTTNCQLSVTILISCISCFSDLLTVYTPSRQLHLSADTMMDTLYRSCYRKIKKIKNWPTPFLLLCSKAM